MISPDEALELLREKLMQPKHFFRFLYRENHSIFGPVMVFRCQCGQLAFAPCDLFGARK